MKMFILGVLATVAVMFSGSYYNDQVKKTTSYDLCIKENVCEFNTVMNYLSSHAEVIVSHVRIDTINPNWYIKVEYTNEISYTFRSGYNSSVLGAFESLIENIKKSGIEIK